MLTREQGDCIENRRLPSRIQENFELEEVNYFRIKVIGKDKVVPVLN
jgi:hypothetical protein